MPHQPEPSVDGEDWTLYTTDVHTRLVLSHQDAPPSPPHTIPRVQGQRLERRLFPQSLSSRRERQYLCFFSSTLQNPQTGLGPKARPTAPCIRVLWAKGQVRWAPSQGPCSGARPAAVRP